jgi:hypothetical protein
VTARHLLVVLLAPLLHILNQPCAATTAASLSDRIAIDGDLSDWAPDEWVLDADTTPYELSGDSRWGPSDDLVRVGVTWDANFLYLAVEFFGSSTSVLAALGHGPGGLATLDGAGVFRRVIDFPFAANVLALANERDVPTIARVDDRSVLVLLDRAQAPAAVRAPLESASGFEAALPWSMLSLDDALQLTLALTGDVGTGAVDAAPDPSVGLPETTNPSSKARASLDRWLSIDTDADGDGAVDVGVSPRVAVIVLASNDPSQYRYDQVEVTLTASPRAFAPDRGEETAFTMSVHPGDELFITARVYSVTGALVRVLYENAARDVVNGSLATSSEDRWDGRDQEGRVVPGGVYVIAIEWGLVRGERAGRATAGVAVAR